MALQQYIQTEPASRFQFCVAESEQSVEILDGRFPEFTFDLWVLAEGRPDGVLGHSHLAQGHETVVRVDEVQGVVGEKSLPDRAWTCGQVEVGDRAVIVCTQGHLEPLVPVCGGEKCWVHY